MTLMIVPASFSEIPETCDGYIEEIKDNISDLKPFNALKICDGDWKRAAEYMVKSWNDNKNYINSLLRKCTSDWRIFEEIKHKLLDSDLRNAAGLNFVHSKQNVTDNIDIGRAPASSSFKSKIKRSPATEKCHLFYTLKKRYRDIEHKKIKLKKQIILLKRKIRKIEGKIEKIDEEEENINLKFAISDNNDWTECISNFEKDEKQPSILIRKISSE